MHKIQRIHTKISLYKQKLYNSGEKRFLAKREICFDIKAGDESKQSY